MILLNHGVVSSQVNKSDFSPANNSVQIIESVIARTNVVSTTTKSVTIEFTARQEGDEVLLFLLYQDHVNAASNETIPANLVTLANTNVNSVSLYGRAKYAVYKRELSIDQIDNNNFLDILYTFQYNSSSNGLLTVRGYRLRNADYNNITLATRSLQTNVTSQIIPSSSVNVLEGDATFVQHMMNVNSISSISNSYVNGASMFSSSTIYRARSWHKIHTTNNTAHNANITWNTSGSSLGFMVHVPHI